MIKTTDIPNIKIEVQSTSINIKKGMSKNNKPYQLNIQTVYFHTESEPYPQKTSILLANDQSPYNVGFYSLSTESINVDHNNKISLQPVLLPFITDAKKTA